MSFSFFGGASTVLKKRSCLGVSLVPFVDSLREVVGCVPLRMPYNEHRRDWQLKSKKASLSKKGRRRISLPWLTSPREQLFIAVVRRHLKA